MDAERLDQLRLLTHQKMIERGEKDRLKELLKARLLESGFNDRILLLCKNFVRNRGVDSVNIDDIFNYVTPEARKIVPDSVKRELLNNIKQFISDEMPKSEERLIRDYYKS